MTTSETTAGPGSSADEVELRLLSRLRVLAVGYDVFISYRHSDGGQFAADLELKLARMGIRAFRDAKEVPAGESISERVRSALRRSTLLVVVETPDSLLKRRPIDWMRWEVTTFCESDPSGMELLRWGLYGPRRVVVLHRSDAARSLGVWPVRGGLRSLVCRATSEGDAPPEAAAHIASSLGFVRKIRVAGAVVAGVAALVLALGWTAFKSLAAQSVLRSVQLSKEAEVLASTNPGAVRIALERALAAYEADGNAVTETALREVERLAPARLSHSVIANIEQGAERVAGTSSSGVWTALGLGKRLLVYSREDPTHLEFELEAQGDISAVAPDDSGDELRVFLTVKDSPALFAFSESTGTLEPGVNLPIAGSVAVQKIIPLSGQDAVLVHTDDGKVYRIRLERSDEGVPPEALAGVRSAYPVLGGKGVIMVGRDRLDFHRAGDDLASMTPMAEGLIGPEICCEGRVQAQGDRVFVRSADTLLEFQFNETIGAWKRNPLELSVPRTRSVPVERAHVASADGGVLFVPSSSEDAVSRFAWHTRGPRPLTYSSPRAWPIGSAQLGFWALDEERALLAVQRAPNAKAKSPSESAGSRATSDLDPSGKGSSMGPGQTSVKVPARIPVQSFGFELLEVATMESVGHFPMSRVLLLDVSEGIWTSLDGRGQFERWSFGSCSDVARLPIDAREESFGVPDNLVAVSEDGNLLVAALRLGLDPQRRLCVWYQGRLIHNVGLKGHVSSLKGLRLLDPSTEPSSVAIEIFSHDGVSTWSAEAGWGPSTASSYQSWLAGRPRPAVRAVHAAQGDAPIVATYQVDGNLWLWVGTSSPKSLQVSSGQDSDRPVQIRRSVDGRWVGVDRGRDVLIVDTHAEPMESTSLTSGQRFGLVGLGRETAVIRRVDGDSMEVEVRALESGATLASGTIPGRSGQIAYVGQRQVAVGQVGRVDLWSLPDGARGRGDAQATLRTSLWNSGVRVAQMIHDADRKRLLVRSGNGVRWMDLNAASVVERAKAKLTSLQEPSELHLRQAEQD